MSDTTATLTVDGKSYTLPITTGSEGERGLGITQLRKESACITLDPGYVNTGSCQSAVTFLDGEKGILRYRGYPIEQLAEKSSFLEVSYLLIYGELPTSAEMEAWTDAIRHHSMVHENMRRFYDALPKDAHPMAVCAAAIGALSTFYQDSLDPRDPEHVKISIDRLLAKMPTIARIEASHDSTRRTIWTTPAATCA